MKYREAQKTGLVLAALIAALGACTGGGLTESTPEAQQGDLVAVKVGVEAGNRSVNPGRVESLANYYEVLFKKDNTYYRGEGTGAEGYVRVMVPVDTGYQVLLLAGYNRILLAGGYVDKVNIAAGKTNVVTIELSTLALQWDTQAKDGPGASGVSDFTSTSDFVFWLQVIGKTPNYQEGIVKDRYIEFDKYGAQQTYLEVYFKSATKLAPLIEA
jgi:hypothetical protein